jgi:uncharacterized repeat protein (TIGR02543 family)
MKNTLRRIVATLIVALALPLAAAPVVPSLAEEDRSLEGTACAVLTDEGELVFIRSAEELEDGDDQEVTDITGRAWRGKVYTGVETAVYPDEISPPWSWDWRDITSFRVADGCLVRPASCAFLLCDLHNLETADLRGLDTAGVADFSDLFRFCEKLTSVNLSGINTSCATDMARMFFHCESLVAVDVGGFVTSEVTSMEDMFAFCEKLEELDLSSFDTARLENMSGMLVSCKSLRRLDLSSFATQACTDMFDAFAYCPKLCEVALGERFTFAGNDIPQGRRAELWAPTTQPYDGTWCLNGDVSKTYYYFDLPRVYDGATMAGTWTWTVKTRRAVAYDLAGGSDGGEEYPSSYVVGIAMPLPGMAGSGYHSPTREGHAFAGWVDEDGDPIETIPASSNVDRTVTATWRPYQPTDGGAYAVYDRSAKSLTLIRSTDDLSDGLDQTVTDICGNVWHGTVWGGIEELDATDGYGVPWHDEAADIRTLSVAAGCRIAPISCAFWMNGCGQLASVSLEGLDTAHATSFAHMFDGCETLESIDLSMLDTSSATSMESVLNGCSKLQSADLSGFDTTSVKQMGSMFAACASLERLDVSSFDMRGVQRADAMFEGCGSLFEVTLGENFVFDPNDTTHNSLPDAPSDETHTGNWVSTADENMHYTASQLESDYDGSTMAGTWTWEPCRSFPLEFDLVGGSVPEGQTYPTSYVMSKELPLPGCEGSPLGAPRFSGFAFAGWADESGSVVESITPESRGPRKVTATWESLQIRMRVPVAITMKASPRGDGVVLESEDGDFVYAIENIGSAPVTVEAGVVSAEGFTLGDEESGLADLEADVRLTPVTTGTDPTAEGYDPASDDTYQEHGEIRLSGLADGTRVGPTIMPGGSLWLNKVGGTMGGWSTNDGFKAKIATINWTFTMAPEE